MPGNTQTRYRVICLVEVSLGRTPGTKERTRKRRNEGSKKRRKEGTKKGMKEMASFVCPPHHKFEMAGNMLLVPPDTEIILRS